VLSPLLGNIYLHYVLDQWFETVVKPRLRGKASLTRYADDFAIGFERQDDAQAVMEVLPKRMAKYGLTLHPDKTRRKRSLLELALADPGPPAGGQPLWRAKGRGVLSGDSEAPSRALHLRSHRRR
jgi:hypothetical protein